MDAGKIERVVELLEDDHFRQGGHLEEDQVLRVAERHGLTPLELVALRRELTSRELIENSHAAPDLPERSVRDGRGRRVAQLGSRDANLLQTYLREISELGLLTAEDELRLARRVRAGAAAVLALPDAEASEQTDLRKLVDDGLVAKQLMVASNVRLVVSIAARRAGRHLSLADLVQEGTLGLIRAVEGFDPEMGFRLSTYATWWIRQSVSRAIADKGREIRIPVHAHLLLSRVHKTRRALKREYGREPTIGEIGEQLGREPARLQFLLDVSRTPASLDGSRENDALGLGEFVPSTSLGPEELLLGRETARAILEAIDALPERERSIMRLRYGLEDGHGHTLESIAQRYGVTRERIRQIEAKTLEELRQPTINNPLRELLLARAESQRPPDGG